MLQQISPGEVKTWFPVFTWDTLVDLLCRDWSSLINRQVLRGSLLFASRFSEKYLRLAFFTELLALFLASLNCFQIEGIGCFKTEVFILTLKWRKKPFLPRKKRSVIRAIAHILLGVDSSATITVSPTVSFLLGRNHFWRSCSKGRYSYFQRPQKTFVKYWTCRPLLLE